MVNEALLSLVQEIVITKNDRALLLDVLDLLKTSNYTKDTKKIIETIKKTTPESFFRPLEQLVVQSKSTTELLKSITDLEGYLNQMNVVQLTICYEPTRSQIEELWKKVGKSALIDYSVDKTTLGIQIDYQGQTYKKTI